MLAECEGEGSQLPLFRHLPFHCGHSSAHAVTWTSISWQPARWPQSSCLNYNASSVTQNMLSENWGICLFSSAIVTDVFQLLILMCATEASTSAPVYQGGVGDVAYAQEVAKQLNSSRILQTFFASNGRYSTHLFSSNCRLDFISQVSRVSQVCRISQSQSLRCLHLAPVRVFIFPPVCLGILPAAGSFE